MSDGNKGKPTSPVKKGEEGTLEIDKDFKVEEVEFPTAVDTQSFLDQEIGIPLPDAATPDLSSESASLALDLEEDPASPASAPENTELAPPEAFELSLESQDVEVEKSAAQPEENLSLNEASLADLPPENSVSVVDHNFGPVSELSGLSEPAVKPVVEGLSVAEPLIEANVPSSSEAKSPEDLSVLKRYSSLKEREAREKEAAVHVLKRQMEQFESRLQKSEVERRRVTLQLQETEATLKAVQESREQDRHHLSKMGEQHQEELRALQLRLDNAQFQATKAEKKLEEFRERVRNDIQKIRLRERELANRLELQKRDAEALLAAKDERLLQQKREIDRLDFEIETLQERLVEETHRAEDRSQRLTRALQSLRLAEGMLAGIEEEVLPGTGENGEGEAA